MITIDDCLENRVRPNDIHLGWVVSLENGQLKLSYTVRDFDWKSVQDAPCAKANIFLKSAIYDKIKQMLEKARAKRKTMFYQASSIADMKLMLEADNVKLNLDKLIRAKARSMSIPKHLSNKKKALKK